MPNGTARRPPPPLRADRRTPPDSPAGRSRKAAPPAKGGAPKQGTHKQGPHKQGVGKGMSTRGGGRGGAKPPASRRAAPRRGRRLWPRLLAWGTVAALWLLLAAAGVVLWYARDLPDIDHLAQQTRVPSVSLLADDGTTLASYGDLYGETLTVREMSPWLPRAVMAIEDRRFYDHFGLDLWGLARAVFVNLVEGQVRQGGSTISQQLAKNLFLTPERSLKRKIQEAILAVQLERRYSKDQIFTLYLNRVYLGAGTYGVDAAARRYFGKSARDVNAYEAAVLAGLLKAPSRYNPAAGGTSADDRAGVVLGAMVEAGYLTQAQADAAFRAKSDGAPPMTGAGRYFADWALGQVGAYIGSYNRDLVVQTTLDPRIQRIAEAALSEVLAAKGGDAGASQGAVVVMAPDGRILAMVGGRDYRATQFNRATQALRQPGSAFKLFVFLAGLEAGLTPDSRFVDQPISLKGWKPDNYNDRYYGEVSLREAFARSLNSVAVQVMQRAGQAKVAEAARRLGVTSPVPVVPSMALGTSEVTLLELTGAYAVFANQGHGVWPYGILTIKGTEGTTLFRKPDEGLSRIVAPRIVEAMDSMMQAVVEWGTGKGANPGRPAAGKTGTSQDFRDAWFLGFTDALVIGVWVGNDDGKPMSKVTGGSLPAEIFQRIVVAAQEGQPARPLPGGGTPAPDDPPVSGPSEDVISDIIEKLEDTAPAGATGKGGDPQDPGYNPYAPVTSPKRL